MALVVGAAEGVLPDFATLARHAETVTNARLGWPAPSDVGDAIDDAEYDLAYLEQVFARSGDTTGAARYLVTINPHLARALRNRYQRWSGSWTSADGLLSHSQAVQAVMPPTGSAHEVIRRPRFRCEHPL